MGEAERLGEAVGVGERVVDVGARAERGLGERPAAGEVRVERHRAVVPGAAHHALRVEEHGEVVRVDAVHLERDDLDMAPFDGEGGLGRMYQLFGDEMDAVIEEMNRELVA